jgi:predicted house-cleaning noncanonical NTP pyrophosphatase (MazG superfamily)
VPSGPSDLERMTATILSAVERQLTKYFASISQQTEVAKQATDHQLEDLRNEFVGRLPMLEATITKQRAANDDYQAALQTALEERLAEFANHQHWRMNDLEDKVAALPTAQQLSPEALMEVRQTVRDDMERSFGAVHGRLEELNATTKRQDEAANELLARLDEAKVALTVRIEEGDRVSAEVIDQKMVELQDALNVTLGDVAEQVNGHTATLLSKLEHSETKATDRLLELEARIKEEQGQKIANIEASIGRIGSGFDDAMIAVSQRVLEMENRLLDLVDHLAEMNERLSKVDENALDEVKAAMSAAIGEATLVRIELDRVVAMVDEKVGKQTVRLSEIEGMLGDTMDASTAVQLERLDELERQMQLLDPSQFVRVNAAGATSSGAGHTGEQPSLGGQNRTPLPAMSLNPRVGEADTSGQHTHESEPTFSSH